MSVKTGFQGMKDAITSALIGTTRIAGQISNEDLDFHRSSNPSTVALLDQQNVRLLKLAYELTKAATGDTDVPAPKVLDLESIDDSWTRMVEVFDNLLEKADACLDEFTGSIKRLSPGQEEQMKRAAPIRGKHKNNKFHRDSQLTKPQLHFKNVPKNDQKSPFKPFLQNKPHAMVSLQDSLGLVYHDDGSKHYNHPYEIEIRAARYPPSAFVKADPIPYLSFNDTKATFVDSPEAVAAMLSDLLHQKEIAIDLEHHDEHSYMGLVSLMQISTRKKDWIVDTLQPWRQDLQMLNEVFADPNILKVLHGAFMDIIWLQRDLGLYIVNLFDTFHASRALDYPQKSLAFLLKSFADFDAAKQYQTADWRIRPLPEEMFNYARSDTHYLLYIFDHMRNALIDKSNPPDSKNNLVEEVMNRSKDVALQRYEHNFYNPETGLGANGWFNMLHRTRALFNREQFAVFRAVHQWRDEIARYEDESTQSVMPRNVLYNIAREIPLNMSSLLGCSHPMSEIFQNRKSSLLEVIKRAKADGATGPEMKELMQKVDPLFDQTTQLTRGTVASPAGKAKTSSIQRLPVDPIHAALALRSNNSHFWGPRLSHTTYADPTMDDQSHCLALPLPDLTADIFKDNEDVSQAREYKAIPSSAAPPDNQDLHGQPKQIDTLTLEGEGGPRKRKAPMAGHDTARDTHREDEDVTTSIDASLDQNLELKRKRLEKAERKADKRRRKAIEEDPPSEGETRGGDGSLEAFDYANAPSILHAKQSGADRRAASSQGINPYAKSMDAPRGMRKSKKEIAGKSHTFKI